MRVTLTINGGDNDAFAQAGREEVARILREAAQRIEDGSERAFGLYDVNGNKVGRIEVRE